MYLKKLIMQGFRSFADPVTVEFDRGITCAAGTEDSGKTYIADALRWVLGQDIKSMPPAGSADDILFEGTESRKSRGMAEVSLVIDNSDHDLSADFSEVTITRRMDRSGESEYLINGNVCCLRDIRELIMDKGIGVDGYSIIGQENISEIISSMPENRRAIFQKAAGIEKYRRQKAETEQELEITLADMEKVSNMISELEERIEPLRKDSENAGSYIALSEQYKDNEINLILKNIEQVDRKTDILRKNAAELNQKLADSDLERSGLDTAIALKKKTAEELELEDNQARDEVIRYNRELDELRNSVNLDNEKINALSAESNIHRDSMQLIQKRISYEESTLRERQTKASSSAVRAARIDEEMTRISAELQRINAEAEDRKQRFDIERNRMYEVSLQSASKGAELSGIRQIRKTLEDRLAVLKQRRDEQLEEISYENEYNIAKRRCDSLEQTITEEEMRLSDLRLAMEESSVNYRNAVFSLANTEKDLGQALARKDMLEELENSYEGYSNAVSLIMNESGLDNIYGPVGSLIQVPPGFENAIEAALGQRVQDIVCKDEYTVRMAVRMLKTRHAGSLTFLPVDDLRDIGRQDMKGLDTEDGYIGIAADCVRHEEGFTRIIEYLLGTTVIVRELDDAIHLSKVYPVYRFVTLDGEFIDTWGAITGGWQKNASTGILERKNRFYAEDRVVHQLETELRNVQINVKKSADDREVAAQNVKASEERLRSLELELINVRNEAAALKQKAEDYNANTSRTFRELELTEHALYENAGYISALEKEKAVSDSQMEALRISIDTLSAQAREYMVKADELRDKFASVCIMSEAAKTEAAAAEAQISESLMRIEELRADLVIRQEADKVLEAGKEGLWNQIAENTLMIREKESECSLCKRKLEEIKMKKLKLAAETEKLRTDRESLDKTIFALSKSHIETSGRIELAESRIDDWKQRLRDEHEISLQEALENKKVIFDINEGMKESKRLRIALRDLGDVNLSSITEYESANQRYASIRNRKKELEETAAGLRRTIQDMDIKIRAAFRSRFDAININFRNIFAEFFGGGSAELRADRASDPLDIDIEIFVQPPGRKMQNMNLLSGAEKTMTAIALIFAVLKTKPAPLCLLDEVEAALDEISTGRFAGYLKKLEGSQFLILTHRRVTMEFADRLYGVTMPEKGISKIVSLKLSDAADWEVIQ